MGYYVRVLSTSTDCVPVSVLHSALEKDNLEATLSIQQGTSSDWIHLILSHSAGREIASIERNPVEEKSLGSEELAEFAEQVAECNPPNAAKWLVEYFSRIRCIYAFQILAGAYHENGWEILDNVRECIRLAAPSILQADNEGFTNEAGYHILWQFNEAVEGDWWMAVLQDGQWVPFEMNLGNREQRQSFFRGQIPKGARLP
jgi:hypothetical protein